MESCIWCNNTENISKDHIFPRSIGGTLQLAVPACKTCQQEISHAEEEVSRRSIFALYRFDQGPPPRDRQRSDSGSIEAKYIFVKDDNHLGGYIEIGLRSKELPITLPSIEIDTNTMNIRCRGRNSEDIDKLIAKYLNEVLNGGIQVSLLTETESDYNADADWWPRIVSTLKGQLKIRARTPNEAQLFATKLMEYIQKGVFKDHNKWGTGNIEASTPHRVMLVYDNLAISRVVCKIAYAIACKKAFPAKMNSDTLQAIRLFVRGKQEETYQPPINTISEVASYTEYPDYHLAMLESIDGKLISPVILYGTCFTIDLGNNPFPEVFYKPIIAISKKEGTESNFATDDLSEDIIISINQYIKATS